MWLSHERATSRGSLATQIYVMLSSSGSPSSGGGDLMKRRCRWAVRSAMTESRSRVCMSSHGEINSSDRSKVGDWKINSAQIICIHVVPHFGGVLMMMSPARRSNPSHRALSEIIVPYRTRTSLVIATPLGVEEKGSATEIGGRRCGVSVPFVLH